MSAQSTTVAYRYFIPNSSFRNREQAVNVMVALSSQFGDCKVQTVEVEPNNHRIAFSGEVSAQKRNAIIAAFRAIQSYIDLSK